MKKFLSQMRDRKLRATLFVVSACAALAAMSVPALATESATEEKLKTVATTVGSEGVNVVLVVLGAITALIVAIIVIPKAIRLIKTFI